MDVAASEFASQGAGKDELVYDLKKKQTPNDGSGKLSGEAMRGMYAEMAASFPVVSIEDPFDQDE